VPISYHEILLTAKIVDSIFAQLERAVPQSENKDNRVKQLHSLAL
jgi:hypothetical protein